MTELVKKAIDVCERHRFFFKYIAPNDVSLRSHQYGFLIPVAAGNYIFGTDKIIRDVNIKRAAKITWNDNITTYSVFTSYGSAKAEYRLTRFGRQRFPYLDPRYIGSLLIIAESEEVNSYCAYILEREDEIQKFIGHFGINPALGNGLIDKSNIQTICEQFKEYITALSGEFPKVKENTAKSIEYCLQRYPSENNLDELLIHRWDTAYELFKCIQSAHVKHVFSHSPEIGAFITELSNFYKNPDATNSIGDDEGFERFLKFYMGIINRRKSFAGKTLEYQLEAIFKENSILYSANKKTEGTYRPDFIFPGIDQYHSASFPESRLTFLGAKTTCKDRWRQVLSEARRIKIKHLFTLQHGLSLEQLLQMKDEGVQLVIPEGNKAEFPREFRSNLMNLSEFIRYVKEKQGTLKSEKNLLEFL